MLTKIDDEKRYLDDVVEKVISNIWYFEFVLLRQLTKPLVFG